MMHIGVTDHKTMGDFVMDMKSSAVGLCLTCNNSSDCAYRKRRGADAIYCETFDAYVPVNGKGVKEGASVVMMTKAAGESTDLKGLCLNCIYRDDCKLSKPETGVWHCEEYE